MAQRPRLELVVGNAERGEPLTRDDTEYAAGVLTVHVPLHMLARVGLEGGRLYEVHDESKAIALVALVWAATREDV